MSGGDAQPYCRHVRKTQWRSAAGEVHQHCLDCDATWVASPLSRKNKESDR